MIILAGQEKDLIENIPGVEVPPLDNNYHLFYKWNDLANHRGDIDVYIRHVVR